MLRRSDALADGMSDDELSRMVRRGELARLQRGTYLQDAATLSGTARHSAIVAATVAGLRVSAVVSHVSAAVLHGLPLWNVRLDRVHVIRQPPANGSGTRRVHLHVARLSDEEVTVVAGVAVTDLTRTTVDVARSLPFEQAVVIADAALATEKRTREQLRACLSGMGAIPGARRAAHVVSFADGRSESVGESRSRVLMRRLGLPAPDLQVRLRRPDGTEIARCDFGWRDHRTVAEFDGRVKYGRLLRPGQAPGDAVFEEKIREDALRDGGWKVARWTWGDLDGQRVVGDRLRRAFARP
ncbi:type IV toxin-antitoxin system AbiEi family antitoxin domain-containing protein [Geodermatophilus sp. DF01_2]|uniref:type IV toxin-antitoxin system AbiEi family antitoxin domain-containing protein n=1 Tax=Geodermatophilus sp. DF01-2 TaxID=2559610 RepID=UPI00107360E4